MMRRKKEMIHQKEILRETEHKENHWIQESRSKETERDLVMKMVSCLTIEMKTGKSSHLV